MTLFRPPKLRPKIWRPKSKISPSVVIALAALSGVKQADSCSVTSYLTSEVQNCFFSGDNIVNCYYNTILDQVVTPLGQTSCFVLSDKEKRTIGHIEMTMKSMKFKCSKKVMYYTSDVEVECLNQVNCYHAEKCYGINCEEIAAKKSYDSPHTKSEKFMNELDCKKVNLGVQDGCFNFLTEGCSFLQKKVLLKWEIFEVFKCLDWYPELTMEIMISEIGGMNKTDQVVLNKFNSVLSNDIIYTLIGLSNSIINIED